MAWWFLAIACLIVWCAITAVVTGLVHVSPEELLASWNLTALKALDIYLAVINLVTLVIFITDKAAASNGNDPRKRMPEACLLGLCLAGGSVGGLIGMCHEAQNKEVVLRLRAPGVPGAGCGPRGLRPQRGADLKRGPCVPKPRRF